ncbi:MAG: GTPase HflX [Candidatus Palauibacterales bacterium]|nr:GTPase HflX [Candidatus Palauibacterales bacterium]MDP2530110.1 GTPase HflX [Candidatus Palauibacterales bacterium]MDP2582579.1 GTPase HflX [Candidatus Palauibacterales bacterium]
MIDVEQPNERALLVGAPPLDRSQELVDEHLAELARLATTAGAAVVGALVQRLEAPHPATYIGTGKLEELARMARERGATLIVFDEDLSPAQGSAIEERIGVRVMDRTELILDIFALRARTAEAKLQVELAQLQYMRPRLKRMWTHLSRTQGGIGARGPGEQQLETDRRLIDRRIARLGGRLEEIARSRDTQRKARRAAYQVALVGYTNAGKSSILRSLSGSDLFVEDRLFATLDSATRAVQLGEGYEALVTDTVGFIRKLPHHLVASFRATLEEVGEADLLLHVIDASAPNWEHQAQAVDEVLADMGADPAGVLLVFHKVDRLGSTRRAALRERSAAFMGPHVMTTVEEAEGLEPLRAVLRQRIRARRPTVRLVVPVADGRTLAEAYREGEVLSREQNGTEIVLVARVPEAVVGRWEGQEGVRVVRQDAA